MLVNGDLLEQCAELETDHGGVEIAPDVVFAVVCPTRVAAEGIAVHLVALGSSFSSNLDLDSRILGPADVELTNGEADGVGS